MRLKAALLIATAAVLVFGAGSASAAHSVLCKENVSVCPKGSQYPLETTLISTVEGPGVYAQVVLGGWGTINCTGGKVAGITNAHEEGPITGHAYTFWFGNCTPEGCAVNAAEPVEFPWEWNALGTGNGSVTFSNVVLTIACTTKPFPFNCKFSVATWKAVFEGGPEKGAFLKGEGTILNFVSGTGCGLIPKPGIQFRTLVREPTASVYVTG